jgi:hypothetical protein
MPLHTRSLPGVVDSTFGATAALLHPAEYEYWEDALN